MRGVFLAFEGLNDQGNLPGSPVLTPVGGSFDECRGMRGIARVKVNTDIALTQQSHLYMLRRSTACPEIAPNPAVALSQRTAERWP